MGGVLFVVSVLYCASFESDKANLMSVAETVALMSSGDYVNAIVTCVPNWLQVTIMTFWRTPPSLNSYF